MISLIKNLTLGKAAIFLVWLFTISGIIGILTPASHWFLSLTPLNLLVAFLAVIANTKPWKPRYLLGISIPLTIGFIAEFLGVNYGYIFGSYTYGANLGWKLGGVPLIISLNWAVLVICSYQITKFVSQNKIIKAFVAASIMTGLDFIIEVTAPRFDFWVFDLHPVPTSNYIGWWLTSFLALNIYAYYALKVNTKAAIHVLLSILLFFTLFLWV